MKIPLRLTVLLLLITGHLRAQPHTARNLSLQQGLPEYYVSGLIQDKAGFLWVATRGGLARYDGRQFKVFRHRPNSSSSLAGNVILSIQSVSDSAILIQLENKHLQLFNPITEQFSEFLTEKQLRQKHIILSNSLLTPDKKNLWGRYQTQLIRFDRQIDQFDTYPFPTLPDLGHYPGNSFLLTKNQQLYAPVPGYLLQFDPQKRAYQAWQHPQVGLPGKTETYYGTSLLERANGEILISAVNQLLSFHPKTLLFRSIPIPSNLHVQAGLIYQAPDKSVYFTHGMTVYWLSDTDRITPIWTASRLDLQNYFHALLVDRSGVLWIGTNGDGIQQVDMQALPVKTYPYRTNFIQDVLLMEQGLTVPEWAKTDKQIYQLRLEGNTPYLSAGLKGWFELLRGESKSRRFRSLLRLKQGFTRKGIDGGNALRRQRDGTIWMFEPHQGILKADSTGRLLETFPVPDLLNWATSIQPIGRMIWIGSEVTGLYVYDTQRRQIVHHLRTQSSSAPSLPSDHVQCLVTDPFNPTVLWIGTQEGLSRLDTRTMSWQNWTEDQGLPSSIINTLLTDRQGNIWFSTSKGISRIDPRTGQMRHFSTADGLLDIEYRPNHALQLPDGRMAFGGGTGITVFDPLAMSETAQSIPSVLTGLRIANEPIEPGADSPLSYPLNATHRLRLKPNQNFFTIEYAGIQYNKPASLRYRYQLTGVDADWVEVGSQTAANYTQLGPGDYEFRVNTADAGGRWSSLIKTIRIIIDPPWWRTWWAYVLYLFLLAGLIRAYIQYRLHQAQLQQEIRLKEQEAELAKNNADWQTRFFTNITHEFRTPLTLIINPLEKLLETKPLPSPTGLIHQFSIMHRNAQRLLRLINQLLDMAKLEAGQLGQAYSRGNLAGFIGELVDSFRLRAERKNVTLTYETARLPVDSLFDAHKLETIGYNLLANALKFTPEGGQIRIMLQADQSGQEPWVCLQVSDSGIGMAKAQIPHIFDRFYQGRQAEGSAGTGTGIGLFLVAEFTRLLGGTITVDSQLGQGTTVTVRLPLKDQFEKSSTIDPILVQQRPVLHHQVMETVPAPKNVTKDAPVVLVVEDNDELREFIASELAQHYRVLTASNGLEGWQVCLAELPELVISDVMMPQMDGFALVEHIKTTPLTAHITVILLTAKTMTDARIQGLSAGANDYLTKPFNGLELQLRISNLLRHQQQLRQHWQQRMGQLAESNVLVAETAADDPFLIKLYGVLDNELTNSSFSVEQLADELAVSPRTLHRKLSTLTGTNAAELIRSYRLQKAANLLQQGASVSEAAERTGFESLPHFSRSFKSQFAVSPSSYSATQNKP